MPQRHQALSVYDVRQRLQRHVRPQEAYSHAYRYDQSFVVVQTKIYNAYKQWRKSGCHGILGGDAGWIQKAWLGWGVGRGYPFPPGRGSGLCRSPEKKDFFYLKWCIVSSTFCSCPCQKHVEFSAGIGDLVGVEDLLLGNSEYSVRITGLISFLLHYCLVMQAIWCFKFWNMIKSGGQVVLESPTPDSGALPPVIYARPMHTKSKPKQSIV